MTNLSKLTKAQLITLVEERTAKYLAARSKIAELNAQIEAIRASAPSPQANVTIGRMDLMLRARALAAQLNASTRVNAAGNGIEYYERHTKTWHAAS